MLFIVVVLALAVGVCVWWEGTDGDLHALSALPCSLWLFLSGILCQAALLESPSLPLLVAGSCL